ncbi:hypothetical protein AMS68_005519 [Peltaster fructicola]|uniref:SLC26A/SulP transporter domain-containing protein n=1 Tax=Peltaster fructicola TaxID=286661 RepID=A0A6H0XZ03_9PEZI|nr:hypothetical protein AMS68_005519 [Peltaster fructicola]
MTLLSHLRAIHKHNVDTLRQQPLAELSGSLGDLGTLLPLMIAMALQGSIDLASTLVFSGLANIITGAVFGIPLPVQPMKAIASVAISQHFTKGETAAAGLTVGIAVFILSATGLLRWLSRVVPVPVVKGIQVGAGLNLVISAGSSMIKPLEWTSPAADNRLWALFAFLFLLFSACYPRCPYALLVFLPGLAIAFVTATDAHGNGFALWHPSVFAPSLSSWRTGAVDGALPQLPLTTLNSILAVTSLAASLFPSYPPTPSTTSVGLSVASANLIGCWFGAMPICHGSGGLAGQYRFGARSGGSIIVLGLLKLVLGLFVGDAIVPILQSFPKSLLGVMVLAAGVELAKVGHSVTDLSDLWSRAEAEREDGAVSESKKREYEQEGQTRWMVMLITVAGCLGFKNDAVGFLAGLAWHFGLKLPTVCEKLWERRRDNGAIRLLDGDAERHAS